MVAIDYRGYGLSPGVPLEQTCYDDARSAWDYVARIIARVDPYIKPEEFIGIFGHSLGGIIAADLGIHLEEEGDCR